MKLRRLIAPALAVPRQESSGGHRAPTLLAPGSVVALIEPRPISPITNTTDEIAVQFKDELGRVTTGFLAARTPLNENVRSRELKFVAFDYIDRVNAWDNLRVNISRHPGWTALKWLAVFGMQQKYLPHLHAVAREFGATKLPVDDPATTVLRVVRLITGKEITMKTLIKQSRDMQPVVAKKTKDEQTNGKKHSKKHRAIEVDDDEDDAPVTTKKHKVGKGKKPNLSSSTVKEKAEPKQTPKHFGARGPRSKFAGRVIKPTVSKDPNTPNSKGADSWALLGKSISYEKFIKQGGRQGDLRRWLSKKHVKLIERTA
jgi:hypothetical protein